jgi:glycosyltransferase involved in cell wall biosynthesis
MKVLFFTQGFTTHDLRFLKALVQTEHDVLFLSLDHRFVLPNPPDLPENITLLNWAADSKPFRWSDFPDRFEQLKQIFDMHNPDVVHAGPLQTCAFLTAATGYQPLLSMSWGYDLLLDAARNSFYSSVTEFTLQGSSAFIGDCQTIKDRAIKFGMPEYRIITFPWGIELDQYPEIRNKPNNSGFTLISTRAWESIYGIDVIARAFVRAAQEIPGLRIILLGEGSQKDQIREIINQGGFSDRTETPGVVDESLLPSYFSRADMYISASISDGTSISLLQAMASGLPVIVSDIPGNREWVTQDVNGWLFPPVDDRSLAELILNGYRIRSSLHEIGDLNRKVVEKKANWEEQVPKLIEAYDLAVSTRIH